MEGRPTVCHGESLVHQRNSLHLSDHPASRSQISKSKWKKPSFAIVKDAHDIESHKKGVAHEFHFENLKISVRTKKNNG